MINDAALPAETIKNVVPLPTTFVGDATARRSIGTPHRKKTKGIPALHWTTVHSPFGNRDRSGKKSFSAASQPVASPAYYTRTPRLKFLPAGLFDPTFKKDQLESDERKRDLQRRRKLRGNTDASVDLRENVSPFILASYHSQSTDDIPNVNRGPPSALQHGWKREASLSELLLAGPTFRETIAHEEMAEKATNVRRCSSAFSPHEVPDSQNKLKLHNLDWALQTHYPMQASLQKRKNIQNLRPTQREKLMPRIRRSQAEEGSSRSKGAAAAPLRVTGSFPSDCGRPSSGSKLPERGEQNNPPVIAPMGEVHITSGRADISSLRAQPLNALQAARVPDVPTKTIWPHYDHGVGVPITASHMISGVYEKTWISTPAGNASHPLNNTIDKINDLHQKVAAAFFPESVTKANPSILGGSAANGQLWLEAVVVELAEALRKGPPDSTEEGKTDLLIFLQRQRGRVLRKKPVLNLLKRVRHLLHQTANCISASSSKGVLTSGEQSAQCFEAPQNYSPEQTHCAAQLDAKLNSDCPQSNSVLSANRQGRWTQPPLPGAHSSCALRDASKENPHPETATLPSEEANNHVQENFKHQGNRVPPTLANVEACTDMQVKAEQPQNGDDCIHSKMDLEQPRRFLQQRICGTVDCQVRPQEKRHATVMLENTWDLPYSHVSDELSAVSSGRLGRQQKTIRAEAALRREPCTNFPNVKDTAELVTSFVTEDGMPKEAFQCSRLVLSSGMEEKLLAFRESRRREQLQDEPLLQHESLHRALIQLKEENGGRTCFENELSGVWMLHDAIVEQLLDREMKQLVSCADSATRMFVDILFETEALRMAGLMGPACHNQLGRVAGAC